MAGVGRVLVEERELVLEAGGYLYRTHRSPTSSSYRLVWLLVCAQQQAGRVSLLCAPIGRAIVVS